MRVPAFCRVLLLGTAIVLHGCGSSTPTTLTYSQADLTGKWDRVVIQTNTSSAWLFYTLTIDAAGGVVFDTCFGPAGPCTATGTVNYAIDATGVVTASGSNANPTLHGTMTAGKNLIFATANVPGTGTATGYGLHIFRKRVPGVTWSSADVAGMRFVYHSLHTGTGTNWERGVGSTDGTGSMTVTQALTSTGDTTLPPPGFDRFQVDANGLVTLANAPTFHGVMTADKKAIFGVLTTTAQGPEFALMVVLATGTTFGSSDLPGSYDFHVLTSGPTVAASSWARGTLDIASTGAVTFPSAATPSGATTIAGFNLALDSSGAITRPDLPSYLGQMSAQKDFFVRTQTMNGANSLGIVSR